MNSTGLIIQNHVLEKYQGIDEHVLVPEGVTEIGWKAFSKCKNLKTIHLPESVTKIGPYAFSWCENLSEITFPERMDAIDYYAFTDCKRLTSMKIPEGITEIDFFVFNNCTSLSSITLPNSVTKIDDAAFAGCKSLSELMIPKTVKLNAKQFDDQFPPVLRNHFEELSDQMTDGFLKTMFMETDLWSCLSKEEQGKLFVDRHGKTLLSTYLKMVTDFEKLGRGIQEQLNQNENTKTCGAAAAFMELFLGDVSDIFLKELYGNLEGIKAAKSALKKIRENKVLMAKIKEEKEKDLKEAEQWVTKESKISVSKMEAAFLEFYGNVKLPDLMDTEGNILDKMVLQWLLIAHEKLGTQMKVEEEYEKPGIDPKAEELLSLISKESFHQSIEKLADENLGAAGHTKKMYLAYPICRYAKEELMQKLTKKAPSWRSHISGDDAPPFRTFRSAIKYSDTKAAMKFAEKYYGLTQYAKIRGMRAETMQERFLLDAGLSKKGEKFYDLGGQIVVARLQQDLTYLFVAEDEKIRKSLPKKGADPKKYELAKTDFSQLKKDTKDIVKNRTSLLFEEFLAKDAYLADDWKRIYMEHPIMNAIARLLVWQQGKEQFIVGEEGLSCVDGTVYTAGTEKILLAHPMEMTKEQIEAWQKYFTAHQIKQPFLQIWEPVPDPKNIQKDRYQDYEIPLFRFMNQEKKGILITDYENVYVDQDVTIHMKDCDVHVYQTTLDQDNKPQNNLYKIDQFQFPKYTRRVNHIAAYLDQIVAIEHILRDDVSVGENLEEFTLAQIEEWIAIAEKNNCTNVKELLMDYKKEHFFDYSPMDKFVI